MMVVAGQEIHVARLIGETKAEHVDEKAACNGAIARIQEGRFPPRPSDYACAGCPALDVVCAGPALLG